MFCLAAFLRLPFLPAPPAGSHDRDQSGSRSEPEQTAPDRYIVGSSETNRLQRQTHHGKRDAYRALRSKCRRLVLVPLV